MSHALHAASHPPPTPHSDSPRVYLECEKGGDWPVSLVFCMCGVRVIIISPWREKRTQRNGVGTGHWANVFTLHRGSARRPPPPPFAMHPALEELAALCVCGVCGSYRLRERHHWLRGGCGHGWTPRSVQVRQRCVVLCTSTTLAVLSSVWRVWWLAREILWRLCPSPRGLQLPPPTTKPHGCVGVYCVG